MVFQKGEQGEQRPGDLGASSSLSESIWGR